MTTSSSNNGSVSNRSEDGPLKRPGPSVQEILSRDTRPVPPALLETRNDYLDDPPGPGISRERYISSEFYQLEAERMWNRTWQVACRVEEIPHVGDHIIYEVTDYSLIVVRSSPAEIRAFHNVCLHRGRILRETGGPIES